MVKQMLLSYWSVLAHHVATYSQTLELCREILCQEIFLQKNSFAKNYFTENDFAEKYQEAGVRGQPSVKPDETWLPAFHSHSSLMPPLLFFLLQILLLLNVETLPPEQRRVKIGRE